RQQHHGFGRVGELRDRPAIEWTAQALSGITANYVAENQDPRYTGIGMADPFTGYAAYSSILAALLQRQKTGEGRLIDVAMLDSLYVLQTSAVVNQALEGRSKSIEGRFRANVGHFRTKEGRIFIVFLLQKWFEIFCDIIGDSEFLNDPRFLNTQKRQENGDAFVMELERRLAQRPAVEWEPLLVKHGIPAAVVNTLEEFTKHPHVQSRKILSEVEVDYLEHPVSLVGAAYKFDKDGPEFQGPVPALGAHTQEILKAYGYSDEELKEMKVEGVI
ncbi:CoA transferase, partial [Thermodesulfobacteriota bacterium]